MNFFSKNRFVFWLMIFLVILNLSALITFLVLFSRNPALSKQRPAVNPGNVFRKELALTASQSEKVEEILSAYRNSAEPLAASIRDCRIQLLDELAKENPDTNIINGNADTISALQREMQRASVQQYLDLKKICNPEQCRKLSSLYFELYGCQGPEKGMGKGKGKGMMHQYRRGQGHQDPGKKVKPN